MVINEVISDYTNGEESVAPTHKLQHGKGKGQVFLCFASTRAGIAESS